MSSVGGVGVLKLGQLVNVLLFERQWALIIELQLAKRPFHIAGNQTHRLLLSERLRCFRHADGIIRQTVGAGIRRRNAGLIP